MAKYYAPNFSGLLPLFDGKSAAGGKLYAYRAGTSIPAPLFDEDGVELGSWVSIDSNGCADFLLDSALSYKLVAKDSLGAVVGEWDNVKATNAPGGMDNPMTAPGDLIVGGTGGQPDRLAAGTTGQVLKIGADGNPGWSTDEKGMSNPMTAAGDIIVGGASGTPARLGIGTSGKVLTSNGTTSTWEDPATQPGDHKVLTASGDSYPGYLKDKIFGDGDAIRVTTIDTPDGEGGYDKQIEIGVDATGRAAGKCIMADGAGDYGWETPTGDHQLLVSATDAAAGYLGAKLTAGSNITLTPQTDGDGVQTLEISATGGGGGGGLANLFYAIQPYLALGHEVPTANNTYMIRLFAERTGTPAGLTIIQYGSTANTTIRAGICAWDTGNPQICYGEQTFSSVPAGHVFKIPFSTKTNINVFDAIVLEICYTSVPGGTEFRKYVLPEASTVRKAAVKLESGQSLPWSSGSTTLSLPLCGLYYDS